METQEIAAQLQSLEQQRTALEAALVEAREEKKGEIIVYIREIILAEGFDIDEIAAALPLARKRSGAARQATSKASSRWVLNDDQTKTYTRGPTPAWMRAKMDMVGFGDGSKESRKAFMDAYMTQQAA